MLPCKIVKRFDRVSALTATQGKAYQDQIRRVEPNFTGRSCSYAYCRPRGKPDVTCVGEAKLAMFSYSLYTGQRARNATLPTRSG